ncbi:MAG: hypothetical protein ABIE23_01570 [archaeon]
MRPGRRLTLKTRRAQRSVKGKRQAPKSQQPTRKKYTAKVLGKRLKSFGRGKRVKKIVESIFERQSLLNPFIERFGDFRGGDSTVVIKVLSRIASGKEVNIAEAVEEELFNLGIHWYASRKMPTIDLLRSVQSKLKKKELLEELIRSIHE